MKKLILLLYSLILVFVISLGTNGPLVNTADFQGSKLGNGNVIYVNDFDEVPVTTGTIAQGSDTGKVGTVDFVAAPGNKYIIKINHPNGNQYILGNNEGANPIQIPTPENTKSELISKSGRYYTDNGDRMIWYEFQNPGATSNKSDKSVFDMSDAEIEFYGFRPWVSWNLSNNTYDLTETLQLYGVHHAGKARQSYVDIVFPIDIDKLLMIEMQWSYAYQKAGGLFGWTEDRQDYQVRYADTKYHATNGWLEFKKYVTGRMLAWWIPRNVEGIQELSVDNNYKSAYVSKINTKRLSQGLNTVSSSTLFGGEYSVQRVYMNTYSNGLWTGYRVNDDLALVDLQYIYEGVYYHPVIDDVKLDFQGGQDAPVQLPDITDILPNLNIGDYAWIFWISFSLLAIWIVLSLLKKLKDLFK